MPATTAHLPNLDLMPACACRTTAPLQRAAHHRLLRRRQPVNGSRMPPGIRPAAASAHLTGIGFASTNSAWCSSASRASIRGRHRGIAPQGGRHHLRHRRRRHVGGHGDHAARARRTALARRRVVARQHVETGTAGGHEFPDPVDRRHRLFDRSDARQFRQPRHRRRQQVDGRPATARCTAPAGRPRRRPRPRSAGTVPPASAGCRRASRPAGRRRRCGPAPARARPPPRCCCRPRPRSRGRRPRSRARARPTSSASSASVRVTDSPVVPPMTMPEVPAGKVPVQQPVPGLGSTDPSRRMGVTIATRLPVNMGILRHRTGRGMLRGAEHPRQAARVRALPAHPLNLTRHATPSMDISAKDPMKQHLAVSAIGSDRTGMVHDLTRIITDCGGSIAESRMATLGSGIRHAAAGARQLARAGAHRIGAASGWPRAAP